MKKVYMPALAAVLLYVAGAHAQPSDAPRVAAMDAVKHITAVCEAKGLLACEQQLHGMDLVFDYARAFHYLATVEKEFAGFLAQQYSGTTVLDFDVLQVSLKLSLDVTVSPEALVKNITSVAEVPGGYNIVASQGKNQGLIKLRRQKGLWHLYAPSGMTSGLEQLQPYYLAAQLKRSILTYRMLEARIAGLSKDELESRVSEDLAPIVVAVLGKENVPSVLQWLTKDLSEVIGFYEPFKTIEAMEAHIHKVHGLE